jgi:hypothetical protein
MHLTETGLRALVPNLHGKIGIFLVSQAREAEMDNAHFKAMRYEGGCRSICLDELRNAMASGASEEEAIATIVSGSHFTVVFDVRKEFNT